MTPNNGRCMSSSASEQSDDPGVCIARIPKKVHELTFSCVKAQGGLNGDTPVHTKEFPEIS